MREMTAMGEGAILQYLKDHHHHVDHDAATIEGYWPEVRSHVLDIASKDFEARKAAYDATCTDLKAMEDSAAAEQAANHAWGRQMYEHHYFIRLAAKKAITKALEARQAANACPFPTAASHPAFIELYAITEAELAAFLRALAKVYDVQERRFLELWGAIREAVVSFAQGDFPARLTAYNVRAGRIVETCYNGGPYTVGNRLSAEHDIHHRAHHGTVKAHAIRCFLKAAGIGALHGLGPIGSAEVWTGLNDYHRKRAIPALEAEVWQSIEAETLEFAARNFAVCEEFHVSDLSRYGLTNGEFSRQTATAIRISRAKIADVHRKAVIAYAVKTIDSIGLPA